MTYMLEHVGGDHDVAPLPTVSGMPRSISDTTKPSRRSCTPSCPTAPTPITPWPNPRICSPSRPSEQPRSSLRADGRLPSHERMWPCDVVGPVLSLSGSLAKAISRDPNSTGCKR
jgi:hypothetical protein